MSVKEKIEDVLWKYFEGETEGAEERMISDWLDENKQNRQLFSVMKKAYVEIEADALQDDAHVERAYDKFIDHINRLELEQNSKRKEKHYFMRSALIRYASVAAIIIGVGLLAFVVGSQKPFSHKQKKYLVEVPYGSRTSMVLPDGSKIWLNAGSKFKYYDNFGKKTRDVYLEGEAFFEVVKKNQPFIVHTSHIDIKVLGTSFNVKSYPDDNKIEATLVEGNIMIERKESNHPLYLKPHEKLTYSKSSKSYEIRDERDHNEISGQNRKELNKVQGEKISHQIQIYKNVNTEVCTAWRDGKLIINDESLEDLAKILERKYDIKFKFKDDKLKHYSYTGTLRDFPLEQVLHALELTSPVHYSIREKTIWLSYNKDFKPKNLINDDTD
jgi:transmembrane sensor